MAKTHNPSSPNRRAQNSFDADLPVVANIDAPLRLCRMSGASQMSGLSVPTIYRLIKRNQFPMPRDLGAGMIGFIVPEIEQWIRDRPAAIIGQRTKRFHSSYAYDV